MTDWKNRQLSLHAQRRDLRCALRCALRKSRVTRTALTFAIPLAILAGCGAAPSRDNTPQELPPVDQTEQVEPAEISLDLPPSLFGIEFDRADRALAEFDWMAANVILEAMPNDRMSDTDRVYRGYLQARVNFLRGDHAEALQGIATLNAPQLSPALRYRLLSFKQHILALEGKHIKSAATAGALLDMAPQAISAHWKRTVWLSLQRSAKSALGAARLQTTDERWLAWLDLALLSRNNSYALGHELRVWLGNNPGHPAADPLPGGLQPLLEVRTNPGKVALMLPLNGRLGPAGNAVMEGYLAAHYAARATGGAAFDLMIINTSAYDSAAAAYADAVRNRAGIVVGPLSKEAVTDLALELDRPIPILALNRVDADIPPSGSAMVQLSLDVADEANTIARRAFGTGARNALLIRPDSDWGNELDQALDTAWTNLGGSIAAKAVYQNRESQSESLQTALGLSDSKQRSQKMQAILNEAVEFTPRRRQDPDVVFLLARNAAEARSIKPLLAYHYAAKLPVFGISSLYSGIADKRDRDLNGINLIETPWLLGQSGALQLAIDAGGTSTNNYTRLNALGAEAFLLQSEFQRLGSGADTVIRGHTGLLTMNPRLQIQRELSPATFDKGKLAAQ